MTTNSADTADTAIAKEAVEANGAQSQLDTFAMGVEDILRAVDDTHAGQFGNGELGGLGVGHVPEIVTLVAEVFEADPDGIVDILDEVGAPVVEDLETTDLVTGILHVDPAIGHDGRVAERGDVGGVLEAHVLDEQSDGDEITVGQTVGDEIGRAHV